jgi:hypothetical protein
VDWRRLRITGVSPVRKIVPGTGGTPVTREEETAAKGTPMPVDLTLEHADVCDTPADLLLLKYARARYGADDKVAARLLKHGLCTEAQISPNVGEYALVETRGAIAAKHVLFIGTARLGQFRYKEMRSFARQALDVIRRENIPANTLATTVHGTGYGLDPEEALQSLVFGFQQGLADGPVDGLEKITFVERNDRLADQLRRALATLPPRLFSAASPPKPSDPPVAAVPKPPPDKKRVFVAMAFSDEFEDVYQFGIYDVVRRCGLVCERIDETVLAGNIVEQIQDGIRAADFVIADLSGERPNVYLEVGYAWGIDRRVILLARENTRLHFDLSQHRCIFYKTIKQLARDLEQTVRKMTEAP